MMRAARPVAEWLADAQAPRAPQGKLELTQRIRDYAGRPSCGLPDNPSYRRYADLHRSAAVWNVVAAPPYSLTLKTWCFPVAGCVGYRGYYDEARCQGRSRGARAARAWRSAVYPVPAYSTLGLDELGRRRSAAHHLHRLPRRRTGAHRSSTNWRTRWSMPGDTMFNESFATAVERIGGARWLAAQASEAARDEYAQFDGAARSSSAR